MAEVTYEAIEKANACIKTLDIKGKEYAEVPQRVKAFRMVYPTGSIETYQTRLDGELGARAVEFTCNIYAYINGEKVLLSSGTAEEKENSTFINKTSFIENCETSAVGRALGFAGFMGTNSIASYEEVTNAINNQKPKDEKITSENWKQLNKVYSKEQIKEMFKELNISNGKDMPNDYAVKKINEYLANIKNELPAKEFY